MGALEMAITNVRDRLARNGRNPANNNAGIRVGSDLHYCEMFLKEIDRLRAELAEAKAIIGVTDDTIQRVHAERAAKDARIAALETAGKELHKCLTAMVDRWEPDTDGLDRVMWENVCEALGRNIWAHLKTT